MCEIYFEAFKALKEPHKTKYTVCMKAKIRYVMWQFQPNTEINQRIFC